MDFGIYTITNPAGEKYIGASHNIRERWRTHKRHGKRGEGVNRKLQASFDTFGVGAHALTHVLCPLPGVPLHELEAALFEQEAPELNVKQPTPLPDTTKGVVKIRAWGEYPSLAEAARRCKLTIRQARYLSRKYASPEEAVLDKLAKLAAQARHKKATPPPLVGPKRPPQAHLVCIDGEWNFPSRHAKNRGVSLHTLYARKKKFGIEATLTAPGVRTPPILLAWRGVTKPLNQWCRENGVAEKTREFRKRAGWTLEEIAGLVPRTIPRKPMNKRQLTVNGKTMYVADWAKHAGISYQTLMSRLNTLKWTPEQAVGLVPSPKDEAKARAKAAREESERRRKARLVTVDGIADTLAGICRQLNLPHGRMDYLIRTGAWTPQEAADYLRRV